MDNKLRIIQRPRITSYKINTEPTVFDQLRRLPRARPKNIYDDPRPSRRTNKTYSLSRENSLEERHHSEHGGSSFLPSLNDPGLTEDFITKRPSRIRALRDRLKQVNTLPLAQKKKKAVKELKPLTPLDNKTPELPQEPKKPEDTTSISQFFEYTIKYSCRSASGRTTDGNSKVNQDSFIVSPSLNGRSYRHFFGICDGHGSYGHQISTAIKHQFMRILSKFKVSTADLDDNYETIIKNIFLKVEKCLLRDKTISKGLEFSGSTCTTVWMNNSKLYCANLGDSRAIIASEGISKDSESAVIVECWGKVFTLTQLSKEHKLDRRDEALRVVNHGGEVGRINGKGPLRIWAKGQNYPGLSMSRSFGDSFAHTLGVTTTPEITQFTLTKQEKVMVIGSDGLWEFMTNEEVLKIAGKYYESNDIDGACKQLLETARWRWQQNCKTIDDVTFLIFFFNFD